MGIDEIEADARRQLAELHREYEQRAQPLIDILMRCHSMRPPAPIIIEGGDWGQIGSIGIGMSQDEIDAARRALGFPFKGSGR